MNMIKAMLRGGGALVAALATSAASAGYFQWDTVELPAGSGASCGNGTPYRFFVNRTPFTRATVIVYEGGGACWDQAACEGQGKLSASNPNGVPANYMSLPSAMAVGGLVTPFSARLDPFQAVQTQSWNLVYLPYCTGDVHSGNKLTVYDDSNPSQPRVQYHRGEPNVRAAAQWMRTHMGRPSKLLLTGFSAGGVGSTVTYSVVRDTLQPTGRVSLLADSGPLMPAPRNGTPEQYPSLPLHDKIRSAWGLDEPGGLVTRLAGYPGFDPNNFGSVGGALARRYPGDRFGYMVFQADADFSAFSYEKFYPDIANAPTPEARLQALYARWQPDLMRWTADLAQHANVSYHVPYFRRFNESHCLTVVDFSGTGIEEKGIASISPFIDNTLDRGPVMRNVEADQVSDLSRPLSFAMAVLEFLLRLFN